VVNSGFVAALRVKGNSSPGWNTKEGVEEGQATKKKKITTKMTQAKSTRVKRATATTKVLGGELSLGLEMAPMAIRKNHDLAVTKIPLKWRED